MKTEYFNFRQNLWFFEVLRFRYIFTKLYEFNNQNMGDLKTCHVLKEDLAINCSFERFFKVTKLDTIFYGEKIRPHV